MRFSVTLQNAYDELSAVYVTFRKGKVAKTVELCPEVFADYDAAGKILGIEFAEPQAYDVKLMGKVAKKANMPVLRSIDMSALAEAAAV